MPIIAAQVAKAASTSVLRGHVSPRTTDGSCRPIRTKMSAFRMKTTVCQTASPSTRIFAVQIVGT